MRLLILPLAALPLLLLGCKSNTARVVGTWKGKLEMPKSPDGLANVAKDFEAAVLGDPTLEFNLDGKYKESLSIASLTGTFTVHGDEVRLTPDSDRQKPQVFILSGDTLRKKKEFDSDPDFVLTRQPTEK